MTNLIYLGEPVTIKGTDYVISAVSPGGEPYGLLKKAFIGDELYDLERSQPLIPVFTRRMESGDETNVPDYEDLEKATKIALAKADIIKTNRNQIEE